MIPFTKPFLPNRKDFDAYIDNIWDNHWLTNQGPLVSLLEKRMGDFLNVPHISFVSSGTMALQLVLKSLPQKGEIITTPYSYVATTSAIVWEGHKPVFADVLSDQLNMDPQNVTALISEETVAILATHTYGNECKIAAFEHISKKFGIPLIYDGAHSFGSTHQNKSLLAYGDYTILSTHATKLFHTANGGFVISKTAQAKDKIDRLKNFGHDGPTNFNGIGINGKNSEFHAALGLCLLDNAEELIAKRRQQWNTYAERLASSPFSILTLENKTGFNGSYFPVICPEDIDCEKLLASSKQKGIEMRRYFYPSLDTLSYVNGGEAPISRKISERVFCLPMYHDMPDIENRVVTNFLNSF